jgi:hypothetical protein
MRYSVKILGLCLVLLIGIFVGIDSAEKNIQKMQGVEGAPGAIELKTKGNKLEINVLGQVVKSKPIDTAKVEKVQNTLANSENALSNIGNFIGSNMRYYSRMMLGSVFSFDK